MSKEKEPICEVLCIHEDEVKKVRAGIPSAEALEKASLFFKVFGDPSRMKILFALKAATLCVCDLAVLTGMSQSAVSHQLKTLRQAELVKYKKEGKTALYSLKDAHVESILSVGMEHIGEKGK